MTTQARRGWLGVATLVATAIVATGCGSSSSSSTSSASSAPASASSTSTSATTPASTSGAGGAGSQSVTNYQSYVGGKAGAASSSLPPVTIGFVNQQGGSQSIGPLATTGAQIAVKYINTELGGIDGHPLVLKTCFIRSAEEEGTTCGQQFLAEQVHLGDRRGRGGDRRPVAPVHDRLGQAGDRGSRGDPDRRGQGDQRGPVRRRHPRAAARSVRTPRMSCTPRPRPSYTRTSRASPLGRRRSPTRSRRSGSRSRRSAMTRARPT